MPYNLMAEFRRGKGERAGGLLVRARRLLDGRQHGADWEALCALTSGCRSGLTFFPGPAGRVGEDDALAISLPLSAAGPELWRELGGLLTRLETDFGAVIIDLFTGRELSGDFADVLRDSFSKFAGDMAAVDHALTVGQTSRWLAGMRATGLDLRFDRESLARLDAVIESNRGELDPGAVTEISKYVGVLLGECLIAERGGEWRYSAEHGEWAVYFESLNLYTFPTSKAAKHLSLGAEHSILYFYDHVGEMIGRGRVDPLLLDWGPATVEVFGSDGRSSTVIVAADHHVVTPEGQERSARFIGALRLYYETFRGTPIGAAGDE